MTEQNRPEPSRDDSTPPLVRTFEGLLAWAKQIAERAILQAEFVLAPPPAVPADGDAQHAALTAAFTAEHYRRAKAQIVASPEEDCAAMATVALRVLGTDADSATPATECSAQHRGLDDGRQCIRAAHHRGDHIDERGFHWSDTVAVYPVATGVVKVSRPFPRPTEVLEDERPLGEYLDRREEDALRTARHDSINLLLECLTAPGRGGLTGSEAEALRQYVRAEMGEADAARRSAQQADSVTAEAKQLLERRTTTLRQRAESAEAATKRVHALLAGRWGKVNPDLVRAALDGTDQSNNCTATIDREDIAYPVARCTETAGHYDEGREPVFTGPKSEHTNGGWHTDGQGRVWSDRAATATPHREQPEAEQVPYAQLRAAYDESWQLIEMQKNLLGTLRRIVLTATSDREDAGVTAERCEHCGRDHVAELYDAIVAADERYAEAFPATAEGPARPGRLAEQPAGEEGR
ncbi:hypothetical protein [Streptomyces sp. NPDC005732]|uniref:hypothetical protein n=1 Tax=Streptomyces sp. NPDC005732 TaxID=3157057 RepID=UPI0033FCEFD1